MKTIGANTTNVILKNSIILAAAFVLAKILGAFYRIPLTNILGEQGIGIYQLVFPMYAFSQVLLTSGISVATTKLIAKSIAAGNVDETKKIFISAVKLSVWLGLTVAGFVSLAGLFISKFQNLKLGNIIYGVLTVCLVVSGIASTIKAYFQGRENMTPTAVTTLCEQVSKLAFGLVLSRVLIKHGVEAGVLGAIVGVLIGEFVVLCVNVWFFKHQKSESFVAAKNELNELLTASVDLKSDEPKWKNNPTKELIKIAIPVTVASSIVPLVFFVDSLIVVKLLMQTAHLSQSLATNQYGILYGIINSLINMPTIFASAVSLSLLPNLTKSKDKTGVNKAKFALQLSIYISIIFVTLFAIFPRNVISFLYKNLVSHDAIKLLKISSVLVLIMSVNGVLTSVFQSAGKFWQNFYVLLVAAIAKYIVLLILFFTNTFSIYIACYLNIGFYGLATVINIGRFMLYYKVTPSFKSMLLTFSMFVLMFGGGILLSRYTYFNNFLTLLVSGSYFCVVFVIFCYFMFKNFREGKTQHSLVKKGENNE